MHNFTTKTVTTLTDHPSTQTFFATTYVEIALRYDYLLHIILALSAFHKAYQLRIATNNPGSLAAIKKYLLAADTHHDSALQGFRKALPNINSENCHAIFGCSTVLFMTSLARPRDDETRDSGNPGLGIGSRVSEWMNLIRGVPSILDHPEIKVWLENGPMVTILQRRNVMEVLSIIEEVPSEAISQLRLLSQEIHKTSDHGVTKTCDNPIEQVIYAYRGLGHSYDTSLVLRWPAVIHQDYFTLLEASNSEALLVLAHYCVLLNTVNYLWWIQGWPKYILESIQPIIEKKWESWLRWPMERVGVAMG